MTRKELVKRLEEILNEFNKKMDEIINRMKKNGQ